MIYDRELLLADDYDPGPYSVAEKTCISKVVSTGLIHLANVSNFTLLFAMLKSSLPLGNKTFFYSVNTL